MPPHPVVLLNGFKYFKTGESKCSAVYVRSELVYAHDYDATVTSIIDDGFEEPSELEFIKVMIKGDVQ